MLRTALSCFAWSRKRLHPSGFNRFRRSALMSISEQLGIPQPPKRPTLRDLQLARFVSDDLERHPSGFCGRALLTASDGYGQSGSQLRKKGWVRRSNFGVKFGRCAPIYTWFLTDSGKVEAKAAVERIAAYKEAQAAWVEQFKTARAAMVAAASAMSAGTAETVQPAQGEARQRGGEAETPNG
jgi:hypothetical protein